MVKCTMMHRENAPRTARRGSARRPGLRDRPAPFQSRVVSEPRPQEALPGPFAHAGASLPRSSSRSVHHYSDSCLRECENRPAVNCARRSESVLHQSDSCLWECGNRPTISKGGGKSRKSRFGISTLSTDRHFHRLRRRPRPRSAASTCTAACAAPPTRAPPRPPPRTRSTAATRNSRLNTRAFSHIAQLLPFRMSCHWFRCLSSGVQVMIFSPIILFGQMLPESETRFTIPEAADATVHPPA